MSNSKKFFLSTALFALVLSGCETTNSIPYKASTANVISIQQKLQTQGKKVNIGLFTLAPGVEENLLCRLNGPVKVVPGKSLSQYIRDAFQEELFIAQVYQANAPTTISGQLEVLNFSSIAPASWNIIMTVKSNTSPGYAVSIKYPFETSWTAYSACKNVANAFGPAVQELLKQVVNHPHFSSLAR